MTKPKYQNKFIKTLRMVADLRNGLSMMKAFLNQAKLSPMPLQMVLVKKRMGCNTPL